MRLGSCILCLLIVVWGLGYAQSTTLPPRIARFVEKQEAVVRTLASVASGLHVNRQQLVRECTCSTSAAFTGDFDDSLPNRQPHQRPRKQKINALDNTTSMIHLSPGTNPTMLPAGLKENICIYKKLDNAFGDFGTDEVGRMYFGTKLGFR